MILPMTADGDSINAALIDALYAEALVLADEARAWFDRARGDGPGSMAADVTAFDGEDDPLFHWAGRHDPSLRIALSCESLRLTTRLMHVIAWLLMQRAISAGEVHPDVALADHNRLGPSPERDAQVHYQLPPGAQRLIDASIRLHQRVAQLDQGMTKTAVAEHPVHSMMDRLTASL